MQSGGRGEEEDEEECGVYEEGWRQCGSKTRNRTQSNVRPTV